MEYTPGERMVDVELDDEVDAPVRTRTGYAITTRGAARSAFSDPIAHLADRMIEKIPLDLPKMLTRPMPGLLVKLHVEGEEVQPGRLPPSRR